MKDIQNAPIHIFYNPEHPNGYTISTSKTEAMKVGCELSRRTNSPVSVIGGMKHWKTGKPAFWIVEIAEPWRDQLSGGYVVQAGLS